ncbi:MAG: pentapeptide repeat-containing protein [bacterium]
MKYFKIIFFMSLVLTTNIFSYKTKDLHEFRYYGKASNYSNKNLSICSHDKFEEYAFYNTKFDYCDFALCAFRNFSLKNTEFNHCDLFGSGFINMNVQNSIFHRCDFTKSTFNKCNLKDSRFILCRGLTPKQIYYIETKGGKIINRVIKIKSEEEYLPTIENLRKTLSKWELKHTVIIVVVPIMTKIKNKMVAIKNKVFHFLDKINDASLEKTKRRIKNMYQ